MNTSTLGGLGTFESSRGGTARVAISGGRGRAGRATAIRFASRAHLEFLKLLHGVRLVSHLSGVRVAPSLVVDEISPLTLRRRAGATRRAIYTRVSPFSLRVLRRRRRDEARRADRPRGSVSAFVRARSGECDGGFQTPTFSPQGLELVFASRRRQNNCVDAPRSRTLRGASAMTRSLALLAFIAAAMAPPAVAVGATCPNVTTFAPLAPSVRAKISVSRKMRATTLRIFEGSALRRGRRD